MKLSPWYPPEVKPVRIGVYEINLTQRPWYRKWNGHDWLWGASTIKKADRARYPSLSHNPWRGLASKPRGKK